MRVTLPASLITLSRLTYHCSWTEQQASVHHQRLLVTAGRKLWSTFLHLFAFCFAFWLVKEKMIVDRYKNRDKQNKMSGALEDP